MTWQLTLQWHSPQGQHSEVRHFPQVVAGPAHDELPLALQHCFDQAAQNQVASINLPAGNAIAQHDRTRVFRLPRGPIDGALKTLGLIPRTGRFYPGTLFSSVADLNVRLPVRIIAMDADTMQVDTNHPLSGYELQVESRLSDEPEPLNGRVTDSFNAWQQLLIGPGMQVRANQQPTDFFAGDPFKRPDEDSDSQFYRQPRLVEHLDATALQQLSWFYQRQLPAQATILDLMSSANSHLPETYTPQAIIGLGMNQQELDSNERLAQSVIHDLNASPVLPFADNHFDAVLCSVSVEYLVRPLAVFREVHRVLKPGGIFINSFSNRWFPPKAIAVWPELHEFERMGLVAEYFLQAGGYGPVNTWSLQGLPRPASDPYASNLPWSDPLYAVWSSKQ